MIYAVHQPNYIPWIGYFHKIMNADVFVFLDNVQYTSRAFQNRNQIRSVKESFWLTVPVRHESKMKIKDVKIDNQTNWRRKHKDALQHTYKQSPFWDELDFIIDAYLYHESWIDLVNLNIYIITKILDYLGIKNKGLMRASEIGIFSEDPNQRLIEIAQEVGAKTYLSGICGRNYMDLDQFDKANIQVTFQQFKHPVYKQLRGKDFIPNMSILDLLYSCGKDSKEIIKDAG